jgi:hemerythrin-like domain-containing protein
MNQLMAVASPQAPDKPDTRDVVAVHRVFRREFRQVADLVLQAPAGDLRRAAVIARHLDLVIDVWHHHHQTEDEYLWPLLLQRATMRADLVHRVEYQHQALGTYLDRIGALLDQWRRTAAVSLAGELSVTLRSWGRALAEHLDDEEQHLLPLAQECLTSAEWAKFGELASAKIPPSQRFTVLGLVLAEASPSEARAFLGMLAAPVRLRWIVSGRRGYARYIKRVHGDALL